MVSASTAECWLRVTVVPVCLAAVLGPAWWTYAHQPTPSVGLRALALLLPIAVVVGWLALRRPPTGPRIHDRQLDLILGTIATLAAIEMLLLAQERPGSFHGAASAVLMSVAIIVVGWGTRALWHLRWALMLLFLAWQAPWMALADAVWPSARSVALAVGVAVLPDDMRAAADGAVLHASLPSGPVTLDPAAGGGVLLLVFAGLLAGLGCAICVSSWTGRLGAVMGGQVLGALAALAVWWVAVHRLSTAGEPAIEQWASGAVQAVAVGVLVTAGIAALGWRLLRARSRASDDTTSNRLQAAVPKVWVSTAVLAVLGVAFTLLDAGTALSAHLPH